MGRMGRFALNKEKKIPKGLKDKRRARRTELANQYLGNPLDLSKGFYIVFGAGCLEIGLGELPEEHGGPVRGDNLPDWDL